MTGRTGWIYALYHVDDPDRIRYVGKTVSRRGVKDRVYHHKYDAQKYQNTYPSQAWIRKHGPEKISFKVLETAVENELNDLEIQWIAMLRELGQADLNALPGGEGVTSEMTSGEKNPKSRMTWARVREIRKEASTRYVPTIEVSEEFGVQWAAASKMLRNDSWYDPDYDPGLRITPVQNNSTGSQEDLTYNRRFSTEMVEEIRQKYLSGVSTSQLCSMYGTGTTSICRVLFRSYGSEESRLACVKFKKSRVRGKLTQDQRDEIVRKVSEGRSKESVAREYGVSPATITYHVRHAKIG